MPSGLTGTVGKNVSVPRNVQDFTDVLQIQQINLPFLSIRTDGFKQRKIFYLVVRDLGRPNGVKLGSSTPLNKLKQQIQNKLRGL